ncbi:MAG: HPr family phosphocarrier protein [Mariprofundaceae bacterium]
MVEAEIIIRNVLGLHARPSAQFATCASEFSSDILLKRGRVEVNGKSIMGIMMLAASMGVVVTICATGADEEAALEALTRLVNNRFGELE